MSHNSRRNQAKSSFLEKPARPEVLRRRMSITRRASESRSNPKNRAADLRVKPMVYSFTEAASTSCWAGGERMPTVSPVR